MKRLSVLATVVFISAFLMTSCGGGGGDGSVIGGDDGSGGGGGTGGITYSGVTTQASLTADNANMIFSLVWNGGPSSRGIASTAKATMAAPYDISNGDGIVPLAKRLVKKLSANTLGFSGRSVNVKRSTAINETQNGSVSGTLTITGSVNETTGRGSITESFANFNDGDGYTYDGSVQMQIDGYDLMADVMTDVTMSFTLWTIKSTSEDFSFTGSIRMQDNLQNNTEIMTINMAGRENISKETFRFANFVLTTVYNYLLFPSSSTETISGQVYIENFGYVLISTASPCIYSDPNANPNSGGPIILDGAENSRAIITPFSYGVRIEVDNNGDATADATNRYFWDNLSGPSLISLTVAPTAPSVPAGLTQHFTATGNFSDNSSKDLTSVVTWRSSDTAIAQISSKEGTYSMCWELGCAYAWALGSSTITAILGDVTGFATMEVSPAAIISLDVHPLNSEDSSSMAKGMTRQYEALATYSNNYRGDATAAVNWSSTNNAIATISNVPGLNGKASSISAGTTTITATAGGISASIPLSVSDWTLQNSGVSSDLNRVVWVGSKFMAVGANGIILTSTDGKTFQERSSSTLATLYDIAGSGTTFVIVGADGTVLTSSDGVAWSPQTSGTGNNLYGVVWSGSTFVAVGASGIVLTSLNGTAWTPQASGTANNLHGITWSGSKFVVVGENGTILTSPDGTAWTLQTSDILNPLGRVAWSGLQFVAVSGSPYDYYWYPYPIHTSTDGMNWSSLPIVPSSTFPPSFIWQSSDVIWCGTQFVVVGGEGNIFTSADGANWTSWVSGSRSFLSSVSCSSTQYVVAGKDGEIIVSP